MKSDYALLKTPNRILKNWWTDCIHRSKNVEIQTTYGIRNGISRRIEADGSLLIEQNGRTEHIMEGTLTMWKEQNPPQSNFRAKS